MLHYQEHKRMLHVCWLLRLWRMIIHVIRTDVLLKSCAFAVYSYWKILVPFLPDIFVQIHEDTASITEDGSNDGSCGTGKTWGGYLCVISSSSEMRNEVEESKCKLLQVRRMETPAAKYKGLQGCVFFSQIETVFLTPKSDNLSYSLLARWLELEPQNSHGRRELTLSCPLTSAHPHNTHVSIYTLSK